jgi:hypothetical protein
VLLFAFDGSKTAAGLIDQVIASQRHAGLKLIAQAVVERDDQGQVHIHEPGRGGVGRQPESLLAACSACSADRSVRSR